MRWRGMDATAPRLSHYSYPCINTLSLISFAIYTCFTRSSLFITPYLHFTIRSLSHPCPFSLYTIHPCFIHFEHQSLTELKFIRCCVPKFQYLSTWPSEWTSPGGFTGQTASSEMITCHVCTSGPWPANRNRVYKWPSNWPTTSLNEAWKRQSRSPPRVTTVTRGDPWSWIRETV